MSKKNTLAARREAHERLLERERQQKAKKEAKRLKFQARAPKKRSIPKGLVRGSSRNPEQYEEARRIVKLRKKAARTAPKKMDLEKLSLIHISEPTRLRRISYAVFCLKKKTK